MKKIVGLLMVMAMAVVCIPVASMAGDTIVVEAKYGANCGTPGAVCVDVKSQLQAICDAQNHGCKTRRIGTVEYFGQSAGMGLYARLRCQNGQEESNNNASGTCMIGCGANGNCLNN